MAYQRTGGKGTRVSYIKESVEEITKMIEEQWPDDPTVQIRTKEFAIQVRDHWRMLARGAFDEERGGYIPSVHIERLPQRAFKRNPQYWVGTRIFYAHMIEYGTKTDRPQFGWRNLSSEQRGGRGALRVSGKTPTEAFGLGAKTAHHFGGTPDSESYERFKGGGMGGASIPGQTGGPGSAGGGRVRKISKFLKHVVGKARRRNR